MKKIRDEVIVALDIGASSIKCVEMARREGQENPELTRVSIVPLFEKFAKDTAAALRQCFDPLLPLPRRARVAVSGPSLLVRRIALPVMSHLELKGAIRFEAEGHIPFPVDDCVLDFQILNQIPEKNAMNVILVAAKRDLIQGRVKMLSDIGIQPEFIDVDVFCLVNAFQSLGDGRGESVYGLLNIGHGGSSFAIVKDKLPGFVREVPTGGLEVTRALAQMRAIPEDQAEALKKNRDPQNMNDLKIATQKGFESLTEELKHSIDYFENETSEELKTIWMSGGGALSVGVAEHLSAELGRPAALWNSIQKIQAVPGVDQKVLAEHYPELAVVLGMALRGKARGK
ncbi:MAG: type IV pilus assembly protein PilM [Candidatus Omnitrophica bacterium]|nr:type IV pilus assembly protein PilM [Candidatus Omnitrophota bacterium]